MSPEEQFEGVVDHFAGRPGIGLPGESGHRGFGSSALKVHGSIFAMLVRGQLVVKLPRDRVEALSAAGTGVPFDANKGRPMKEWLAVEGGDGETWVSLAGEAHAFVSSR